MYVRATSTPRLNFVILLTFENVVYFNGLRNVGVMFGYSLTGYTSTLRQT